MSAKIVPFPAEPKPKTATPEARLLDTFLADPFMAAFVVPALVGIMQSEHAAGIFRSPEEVLRDVVRGGAR